MRYHDANLDYLHRRMPYTYSLSARFQVAENVRVVEVSLTLRHCKLLEKPTQVGLDDQDAGDVHFRICPRPHRCVHHSPSRSVTISDDAFRPGVVYRHRIVGDPSSILIELL